MNASVSAPRGRGRPAGAQPDRREAILAAARAQFADKGYDGATVRGIASDAGVDPALVHHYFGTKQQVFVEAMRFPFDPAEVVPSLFAGPRDQMAERLVRFMLSIWDTPEGREPILALLRSAVTHDAAARMLREFVSGALLGEVAGRLDLPDKELRVTAVASQLVGMALLRHVIKVEPLASASVDEVVAVVARVVQHYLEP